MGGKSRRRARRLASHTDAIDEPSLQQASGKQALPQALTEATQDLEGLLLQSSFRGVGLQSSGSGHINIGGDFIAGGQDQQKPKREPFSTVPFLQDADFVNRPAILAWLHEKLAQPAARVALVGLGGIGKSQIAIHYCHTIHCSAASTFVFWVHSSTRGRFEEAYRGIANRLELPGRFDPNTNVLQLVYNWLSTEENGKWLMVLDNVDDGQVFFPTTRAPGQMADDSTPLATYIPQSLHGSILVTSRDKDAALRLTGDSRNIHEITEMDETMALELLHNKLHNASDQAASMALIQALECIPLAITQAAAYINQSKSTVRIYLNEFQKNEKNKKNLLLKDKGDLRRDPSAHHSVLVTWQISFELIRSKRPSATDLLSLMSFFNPQDIPKWILAKETRPRLTESFDLELDGDPDGDVDSDTGFENDVAMLIEFSLIGESSKGSLNLHALVQLSTKTWLSNQATIHEWEGRFIAMMREGFSVGDHEDWATCQELFPHVAEIHRIMPKNEFLKIWAGLLQRIARYLYAMGDFQAAYVVAAQCVKARQISYGDNDLSTLVAKQYLVLILMAQDDMEAAERLARQVLESTYKLNGEGHPLTLQTMATLAMILEGRGKHEEAEDLSRRALEGMQRVLGYFHECTNAMRGCYAWSLTNAGKHGEAKELFRQVLEVERNSKREEHDLTITAKSNLAKTLAAVGRYEEAETFIRQAISVRQEKFGKWHPDAIMDMCALAGILVDKGDHESAENTIRRALDGLRSTRGSLHPLTQESVRVLVSVLKWQGRHEEAEQLANEESV